MRIDSSTVAMSSKREYSSYQEKKKASILVSSEDSVSIDVSEEGKSLMEQMKEEQIRIRQQQDEQARKNLKELLAKRNEKVKEPAIKPKSKDEINLEILKKMLEALRTGKSVDIKAMSSEMKQAKSQYQENLHLSGSASGSSSGTVGSNSGVTLWKKITVESGFFSEVEHTAFQAAGVAKTSDGREITFGVNMEMTRAFCQKYESFTKEDYICTDPLVINIDSSVASVSDQKFLFDIDSDGEEESISFAGKGSGFLALDKNNDGKINDGSELFGTKSGNGFLDLAQHDKDKNGWIDENDEVFQNLKIWTKDENGEDKLISLKDAGVGAIYLDYASTEFSLKDEQNKTNGVIRGTGVYLKENGGVGTIQHVDLTTSVV